MVVQVADELTRRGYRIWLDLNDMEGNILEAMAKGIDQAKSVIVFASDQYLESRNCSLEAQYAYQQRKSMVTRPPEIDTW